MRTDDRVEPVVTEELPDIPIFRPRFGEAEAEAVARVVRGGWIAMGQEVAAFEEELAARLGIEAHRVIAVSSGTAALHLAMIVAGIAEDDDVATSSLGFIATPNAATYVGARPVFADVDERRHTSGVEDFAAVVTPATRAVVPVHIQGRMAPMDEIVPWAHERGLVVIEDAAPAAGAVLGDRPAGTWGDYGCFSLHSSKPFSAGEGGVLIAPDRAASDRARSLRFHGANIWDFTDVDFHAMWEEDYPQTGYMYRLTDLQAAVARCQLAALDGFLDARREIVRRYDALLEPIGDLIVGNPDDPDASPAPAAFQQYVFALRRDDRSVRDAVIGECRARGVFVTPAVSLLSAQPLWQQARRRPPATPNPVAEKVERTALSIPMFVGMRDDELERVATTVIDAVRRNVG